MSLLQIENVSCHYGRIAAVRGVTLAVGEGEDYVPLALRSHELVVIHQYDVQCIHPGRSRDCLCSRIGAAQGPRLRPRRTHSRWRAHEVQLSDRSRDSHSRTLRSASSFDKPYVS